MWGCVFSACCAVDHGVRQQFDHGWEQKEADPPSWADGNRRVGCIELFLKPVHYFIEMLPIEEWLPYLSLCDEIRKSLHIPVWDICKCIVNVTWRNPISSEYQTPKPAIPWYVESSQATTSSLMYLKDVSPFMLFGHQHFKPHGRVLELIAG